MMKIRVSSSIVFFLLCNILSAQSKSDTLKIIERPLNFSTFFYNTLPDSYFLNEYDYLKFNPNLLKDTASIWIQTRMQLSNMMNQDDNKNNLQTNILDPLSQKYSSLQSMKTLKYILGTVQVSAVGYLAYLHLKKYGFLKKK